ncbi:MAG: hypothetical protein COV59_01660 [Candidatus Magasanikbacteria bacterium CG11_big_fil_rev_8_21_14_0_20_39_34]|uniref:Glycosyltransferase 2-like domain-containing protein n=1 Tax=Candidatus Magasanikbacteria bacterium CG11_big_fil_rev_8_21_14_0_20_39_34 TaxID=1974653 RepID=A0A2H0N610_9BACT|nr:MAG: hypothetical protein COV59_01660 [Candidatus Magasanikbacteria bacterium CG11_big_fil_rev_8_21_14_0_20_39_34]
MLFSIIIPTYNRANLLVKSLESIFAQDYSHFEVIIVDDGSTDNTMTVVHDMQVYEKRLRYIYQKNSGASSARNAGLMAAKGDLIVYLDSDDSVLPNFLSHIQVAFQNNEQACFGIVNQIRHIILVDKNLNILQEKPAEVLCTQAPTLQDYYHWKVKTTSSGLFHKRDFVQGNIFWDVTLSYIEDWDFLLMLGNVKPDGFVFVMEPLVYYTQRYGSTEGMCSNATYGDWANAFDFIYKKHKEDSLMQGQNWWPERVEKYTRLQKLVEEGLEKPARYKYFPEYNED